jgi:hypothetical protein
MKQNAPNSWQFLFDKIAINILDISIVGAIRS